MSEYTWFDLTHLTCLIYMFIYLFLKGTVYKENLSLVQDRERCILTLLTHDRNRQNCKSLRYNDVSITSNLNFCKNTATYKLTTFKKVIRWSYSIFSWKFVTCYTLSLSCLTLIKHKCCRPTEMPTAGEEGCQYMSGFVVYSLNHNETSERSDIHTDRYNTCSLALFLVPLISVFHVIAAIFISLVF